MHSDQLTADLASVYAFVLAGNEEAGPEHFITELTDLLTGEEGVSPENAARVATVAAQEWVGGDERRRQFPSGPVSRLGATLTEDRRRRVISKLVETALRDNLFSYVEGTVIGQIATQWEVHPQPEPESSGAFWTVLGGGHTTTAAPADFWTPLHDLALAFFVVAHQSDRELSVKEIEVIKHRLSGWMPAALPTDVNQLVSETLRVYAQGPDPQVVDRAVIVVGASIPRHQRAAVLADLEQVAGADDIVLIEEKAIIDRLARLWKLREPWQPGT